MSSLIIHTRHTKLLTLRMLQIGKMQNFVWHKSLFTQTFITVHGVYHLEGSRVYGDVTLLYNYNVRNDLSINFVKKG